MKFMEQIRDDMGVKHGELSTENERLNSGFQPILGWAPLL